MAGLCRLDKPACGVGSEWATTPEQMLLCRSCIGPRLPGITSDICPASAGSAPMSGSKMITIG